MNRSLLTPRWLLLHVLFVAAVIATGLLAWWQWGRAHEAGGSLQNLGYALQWPMFGAFTIFMWYRLVSMETRSAQRPDKAEAAEDAAPERPAEDERPARRKPLVPPPAPSVTAEEDPELAAYNRFLADLNKNADA